MAFEDFLKMAQHANGFDLIVYDAGDDQDSFVCGSREVIEQFMNGYNAQMEANGSTSRAIVMSEVDHRRLDEAQIRRAARNAKRARAHS